MVTGDLVLLYLAQDGTYDLASDNINYGSTTSPNVNAGKWQINRIYSRVGSSDLVQLECDLNPAFTPVSANGNNHHRMVISKFFVANTLTLSNGVVISASKFTATPSANAGGIVPILARSILMATSSKITADKSGFSGGVREAGSNCISCFFGCNEQSYTCDQGDGGQQGASIVPYSEDPSVRGYCRGAMANGGGGGNSHNAPGGGGANVCSDSISWNGKGVSHHKIN